jgi:hypothetical protein
MGQVTNMISVGSVLSLFLQILLLRHNFFAVPGLNCTVCVRARTVHSLSCKVFSIQVLQLPHRLKSEFYPIRHLTV